MNVKKITGAATIAGALGVAALGLGAGMAQADYGVPSAGWGPRVHGGVGWNPAPPGQVQKVCPWRSPPGHWIAGPHGIPCT
jgi:hypothetical protein